MRTLLIILFGTVLSFPSLGKELKILTLNVYMKPEIGANFFAEERAYKICNVLKDKKHPHNKKWDIVLIQEAWTVGVRKIFKNCGYKTAVDIGKGAWRATGIMRHRRGGFRPRPGRHGNELNVDSGLLILTNLSVDEKYRYEFKNEGKITNIFSDGEAIANKSVYLIRIQLDENRKFWVANTHLIANYCDETEGDDCVSYEVVRTKQMYEMKNFFNKIAGDDPIVFGGDINSGEHPNSKELSWRMLPLIFPGYKQAPHDQLSIQTSSSENTFKEGQKDGGKLDHIFASPHFDISDGELAFDAVFESQSGKRLNYSDHYGWSSVVKLRD